MRFIWNSNLQIPNSGILLIFLGYFIEMFLTESHNPKNLKLFSVQDWNSSDFSNRKLPNYKELLFDINRKKKTENLLRIFSHGIRIFSWEWICTFLIHISKPNGVFIQNFSCHNTGSFDDFSVWAVNLSKISLKQELLWYSPNFRSILELFRWKIFAKIIVW